MRLKCFVFIVFLCVIACNKRKNVDTDMNRNDGYGLSRVIDIEKAVFTDPIEIYNRGSSLNIMHSLVTYLDHTPKGATIHISIFLLSYTPLVNAIADAAKKGVEIKIMIDSSKVNVREANAVTFLKLQDLFSGTSSEVIGINNQIVPSAINHEKYVLFSKVNLPNETIKNVVFATSHNFTEGAATKAQDAIIISNKQMYDAFLAHWNYMRELANEKMKDFNYTVNTIGDSMTVFFFPRRKDGEWDQNYTILEQLDQVSDYNKDTIRVLMATWSGTRGGKIALRLNDLQRKGVTVQVITGTGVSDFVKKYLDSLPSFGGYLKIMDGKRGQVHCKTMLIKGMIDGEYQKIILTGSENYSAGALKQSNNFLLRLKNSVLFEDYWNYFSDIKAVYR